MSCRVARLAVLSLCPHWGFEKSCLASALLYFVVRSQSQLITQESARLSTHYISSFRVSVIEVRIFALFSIFSQRSKFAKVLTDRVLPVFILIGI